MKRENKTYIVFAVFAAILMLMIPAVNVVNAEFSIIKDNNKVEPIEEKTNENKEKYDLGEINEKLKEKLSFLKKYNIPLDGSFWEKFLQVLKNILNVTIAIIAFIVFLVLAYLWIILEPIIETILIIIAIPIIIIGLIIAVIEYILDPFILD